MTRLVIMVPESLKDRAERSLSEMGISLDQLVQEYLEARFPEPQGASEEDPFFADRAVYTGSAPSDLSLNHDDYLYGNDD